MKKLLAIDGNSIINRAFYGIKPLTNREGIHTNAIYGMINIPRDADHYQLLRTTQREHSGPVNIFALVEDGFSPNTGALNATAYTWSELL